MPSTPLICSSIGVATVSAMTFGLAPGYCARTTTDGGTTSGYSEIGMTRNASRPATKISTDSTPAKIGRSMKNLDRFMACAPLQGDLGFVMRGLDPRIPISEARQCLPYRDGRDEPGHDGLGSIWSEGALASAYWTRVGEACACFPA